MSGDPAAIAFVAASAQRYDAVQTVHWTSTGWVQLQEDALDEFGIASWTMWYSNWIPATGGLASNLFCGRHPCANFQTEPAVERGTARLRDGKIVWVREVWTPRRSADPLENSNPVEVIYGAAATYWRFTDGTLRYAKKDRALHWVPSRSPCFYRSSAVGGDNDFGGYGAEVGTAWYGIPLQIVPVGTPGAGNLLSLSRTAGSVIIRGSQAWDGAWDLMEGTTAGSTAQVISTYSRATGRKTSMDVVVAPGRASYEPGFSFRQTYTYAKAAPAPTPVTLCAK